MKKKYRIFHTYPFMDLLWEIPISKKMTTIMTAKHKYYLEERLRTHLV